MRMLWCRRVATQANTSVGPKNGIFMFLLYKTIYIVFKLYSICIKLLLKNTNGLLSCPARQA